jgi:preprotein translocase subunit SecA
MLTRLIQAIIGDPNEKEIRKKQGTVNLINAKELEYQSLTDEALKAKTAEFKERFQKGETLDDLLVEAFAVVKNACRRLMGVKYTLGKEEKTWDMIPFDCQLIGAMVLHEGKMAEMKTGEGKTLVASIALYLNALAGQGTHLVSVNDYLAKRDAAWMGVLYGYLGLSVGVVVHGLNTRDRQQAYLADITYGTNNEFGFDYLRDNMVHKMENRVQRPLFFSIVDEADSILIDEARTPLIISAPAEESTKKYEQYSQLVSHLKLHEDYAIDEKQKAATLTDAGIAKMEQLLGVENIYTEAGFLEVHHIEQALKAHAIFKLDVDYVIKDDEVIIVDEFTGRLMPGRRYSDGLHQAIEAKERVQVQNESRTLATVTFQNYFRLYDKLAGMSGTAKTEEEELYKIYGLETVVIPTNRPVTRTDASDLIFKNEKAKVLAVVKTIQELHAKGQPVLVGTVSVEKSEMLSKLLKLHGLPHEVLNAKNHEREAEIISLAGQKGAITIATNMAGRGTDIKLGEGVAALGGLAVLATERHESRRIDNQLRGRSGRQGDPGFSRFFVSMDDDLMRLFGSDRIKSMMERLGLPDDMPIENRMITRSIEHAQKRVEGHHFDIRKHLLEYDDVMNKHREIIYSRRTKILTNTDLKKDIEELMQKEAHHLAVLYTSTPNPAEWDLPGLLEALKGLLPGTDTLELKTLEALQSTEAVSEFVFKRILSDYQAKEATLPDPQILRQIEKSVLLRVIDELWMEHIDQMSHLRDSVSLSGYGQRDPLLEYKQEAYNMFRKLLESIQRHVVSTLFKVNINVQVPAQERDIDSEALSTNEDQIESNLERSSFVPTAKPQKIALSKAPIAPVASVDRNAPCPCGSGKKYKKCHGA